MNANYDRRERTAKWLLVYAGVLIVVWVCIEAFIAGPVSTEARIALGAVIGACVASSRTGLASANESIGDDSNAYAVRQIDEEK